MRYTEGNKIFFSFVLFVFISSFTLFGQLPQSLRYQRISSENIRLEQGLSQNDVNCILQDYKGLLWFGTWDGLNIYNGYDFQIFRPNLNTKNEGLSHQTVNAIYEDRNHIIWVGTDKGLNRFTRKNQVFSHYSHQAGKKNSLCNDTVNTIIEDKKGYLWIGTNNGLTRFNPVKNEFSVFKFPETQISHSNKIINQLYLDERNRLWILTGHGLLIYSLSENKLIKLPTQLNKPYSFLSMTHQGNGVYWLGTDHGLLILQENNNQVVYYNSKNGLISDIINSICIDRTGLVWLGTSEGISIFNLMENRIITNEVPLAESLKDKFINVIYEDRAGIIWIGMSWQALAAIDRNYYRFEHFYRSEGEKTGLNSNLVWSFYKDEESNKLWIGTNDGINIMDLDDESFKLIHHDSTKPNSISDNFIRDIYKDSKGIIWISTFNGGLNEYNPVNEKITVYKNIPKDNNSISSNSVWKVFEDSKQRIWVGTQNGLNLLDRKSGKFTRYFHSPGNKYSLSHNAIFSIYEDSKKNIWFCTYNGLSVYNEKKNNFTNYKHADHENSLNVSSVFSVFEDKEGTLWIATMGGGLNSFNYKTGHFTAYTTDKGLASNIVYRIFEDNSGNLWMSTNHGISRFNKKSKTFINYDIQDGVQSSEFNHNAGWQDKDGNIFFGGMNGFNRFNPNQMRVNKNVPPVVITRFSVLGNPFLNEISNGDTIELNYNQNFFSFEFAVLNYSNPAKNKYKYRLFNYNSAWVNCNASRRIADYTKVPPGTYLFQVIGSNNDGIWNKEGVKITIIVKPPWWKTPAFYSIVIILVIIIVYLNIRFFIKRFRNKHEIEKKMLTLEKEFADAQQKALRYQMNPHFIFNSLNSIQHFILKQDEESAHLYLSNFSSLMRKILENSKYNLIRLSDELDTIRLYLELENLRFEDHFDYKIIIGNQISPSSVLVPPMLLQPYLENAIWHGLMPLKTKGTLLLSINTSTNNSLLFAIRDNGIGRENAAKIRGKRKYHKATGMRNIEERLDLMNKLNKTSMKVEIEDLFDQNGLSAGTEVRLYVDYITG